MEFSWLLLLLQQGPEVGKLQRPLISWKRTAAITAVFVILTLLLYGFDPMVSHYFPPCPFHWVTGLYCPGCGSLRAVHRLLHGRFAEAFTLNPLLVLSIPVLLVLAFNRTGAYNRWVPWVALLIIVVYGFMRHLAFISLYVR